MDGYAAVGDGERRLLLSPAAPIVLVRKLHACGLAESVAPGNPWIGALLPYTPLHVLLMEACGRPMVATSANLSEEPLCTDNAEALQRLGGIADIFLVHNRPIARPVDDSVQRVAASGPILLRRARGYAPDPLLLPDGCEVEKPVLAVGGHLKNTVGVAVSGKVVLSPHIGDLSNALAIDAFKSTIQLLTGLYGGKVASVACDLHPDYASTRFARNTGLPVVPVQHHLAHVMACLLEHDGGPERVLGVAFDGTGYGDDGTIWGGEFILVDRRERMARRVARLRPFRLPGGEEAVRKTGRSAFGALATTGLTQDPACAAELDELFEPNSTVRHVMAKALEKGLNAPVTSSAGRLFDAVAALLGLAAENSFEGQGGMSVEFAAAQAADEKAIFPWQLSRPEEETSLIDIDWAPCLAALCAAKMDGEDPGRLAMRFHNTLADMVLGVAKEMKTEHVALTGGCFQNAILTDLAHARLTTANHTVLLHRRLSPNDNSIAAGQIYASLLGITHVFSSPR